VLLFLVVYAWPAIKFNGLGFLLTKTWDLGNLYADPVEKRGVLAPIGATYGCLVFVAGTLASSFLALLVAVPVSLGISIFLAEGVLPAFKTPFAIVVEMLAVVPSVVYGLWGIIVLVPIVAHYIAPGLAAVLGFIPFFRAGGGTGFGLLASSLVLALMVIPVITITVYDAMTRIPKEAKEAAYALGTTKFEMVFFTMLPMVLHRVSARQRRTGRIRSRCPIPRRDRHRAFRDHGPRQHGRTVSCPVGEWRAWLMPRRSGSGPPPSSGVPLGAAGSAASSAGYSAASPSRWWLCLWRTSSCSSSSAASPRCRRSFSHR
jgi:ABC-type phosphate/phosphonate transport system permease subunit